MTLTIDRAGRVVIPKPIRDKLGLRAGSTLEMIETFDGLSLKPAEEKSPFERRGRFLVYTGEVPAGWDPVKAIEEDREARDRKIPGY
jgi:AbrB family looped-hinge helix DNA binding protein